MRDASECGGMGLCRGGMLRWVAQAFILVWCDGRAVVSDWYLCETVELGLASVDVPCSSLAPGLDCPPYLNLTVYPPHPPGA